MVRKPHVAPLAPTWFIVWASLTLLCALYFGHQAQLFRIAVPCCAVLISAPLYRKSPALYLQFTLWAWFLSALIRRLVDWHFGYADQNLVLLTPILVTSVSGLMISKCVRSPREATPFLLCISGVVYGMVIGIIRHASADVLYGFFNWLAPILLGLYIYLHWPQYSEQRRAVERTVLLGVLVMGVYGIYQYCYPPPWDIYWWQCLPSGTPESFGQPVKYGIRVWSTLHAPAPFAGVMCVALLLTLASPAKVKWVCFVAGLGSLLLSLSRTEWVAFALGLGFILYRASRATKIKTLLAFAVLGVVGIPFLSSGPAEQVISARLQSFQHLAQDDSFQTRSAMYDRLLADIAWEPFGRGVSNSTTYDGYALDSGPLRFLLNLGVLGTLLYFIGLLQILVRLIPRSYPYDLPFVAAYGAVFISALAKLISVSPFENGPGVMVWLCIGLGLAAKKYYAIPTPLYVQEDTYAYAS
jgi:O-Antigen ligase